MMNVEKQVKLFMFALYLLLLIVGCAIGVGFLAQSYGQTRETRLEIYSKDIDMWNSTKRAEFADTKFFIQGVKPDGSKVTSQDYLVAKTDESVEHQVDEDKYGDLPQYEPLYYSLRDDASSFGIDQPQQFNYNDTIKFNVLVGEGDEQQSVSIPLTQLYTINSFRSQSSYGCDRLHGHYEPSGERCYQYYTLSNVCVQMDKDEGGNWYINRNKNTEAYGCYTRNHNSTRYEQIILAPGQHIEDLFPLALNKITWEIRSAFDPWLLSMILTEDTSNFGMSTFELRMLGFGLVFCCAGLTIQPICWIMAKFRKSKEISEAGSRQGPYRYDPEYDEYEAPSSGINEGAPASATIEPSADKAIEIQNEMEDLNEARMKPGRISLEASASRNLKRVKRKGEYESYYN